jgi:hypothetical protein
MRETHEPNEGINVAIVLPPPLCDCFFMQRIMPGMPVLG